MTAKEFVDGSKIKILHDLPEGIVALKEEELYELMEKYYMVKFEESFDLKQMGGDK